ncbi:MAG: AAA family ATPase, partial [Meiothermus sp.]|nr:AAA family ATPase [Meiothermus sp.]
MEVRLCLLGTPRLESAGSVSDLPLDRPASLGYYLAVRGDWVRRSELAYLYSPEADEAAALANLRKLVYRLRQQGWAEALEVEAQRLRLPVPTDLQAFRAALERRDWQEALQQYGGTFLQGLNFPDLSGFEAWLELERQDVERAWRTAVLEHVRTLEGEPHRPEAERWLARLLAADPLDEEAVQLQLRRLLQAGQSVQAREVFERFRTRLKAELGVEPLESTRALAEGPPNRAALPAQAAPPQHNLPTPSTPFIGRRRELRTLAQHLANPDCRLLTLVGLGGMGKTRLALELAAQQVERFPEGVWLVALAGVASPEQLVSSIASALGFTFAGPTDPKLQLLNYLRGKALLLLLDNFEHLLEARALLEELLAQAGGLKLLVTSRLALELPGEWLFDLEGLPYPPPHTEDDLDGFDAVRLFISRAERLSNRFVLTPATLEAIAELTRRVQGMPLALELLASWVRGLGVPEILAQLGRSFELLQTGGRDLPERHRSIGAILDYSWQLLSEPEQAVLARLSVFRGGFTLEAAQAVAGAHLGLLLRFINQSLVQRGEDGRYTLSLIHI